MNLGQVGWGLNTARVVLHSRSAADVAVTLQTHTHLAMRRYTHTPHAVCVIVPAGGSVEASVPFVADGEERMSGTGQRMVLTATVGDAPFFVGTYKLGYCGPISVYPRFGADVPPVTLPAPGEPGYAAAKLDSIAARLPRLQRRTTRDGAASDFCITADDGSVTFDLMQPTALQDMAAFVAQRFTTDLDRMLGLLMLAMSPAVMRHMSGGHRIMGLANAASVFRGSHAGGGGNCGYNSRAFAGLANALPLSHDLLAHTVGVWGHSINAVMWGETKALIDADVGHVLLNAAGDGLATLHDLRHAEVLNTTCGPGELARYFTQHDVTVHFAPMQDDRVLPGTFPPNAPR